MYPARAAYPPESHTLIKAPLQSESQCCPEGNTTQTPLSYHKERLNPRKVAATDHSKSPLILKKKPSSEKPADVVRSMAYCFFDWRFPTFALEVGEPCHCCVISGLS